MDEFLSFANFTFLLFFYVGFRFINEIDAMNEWVIFHMDAIYNLCKCQYEIIESGRGEKKSQTIHQ